MKYPEYAGMSFIAASHEAEQLIKRGWFRNFDRLGELHEIMHRELIANGFERVYSAPRDARGNVTTFWSDR